MHAHRVLGVQAMQQAAAARPAAAAAEHYEADLLINDFPQAARYHVTHRDTIATISERTGAALYCPYIAYTLSHILSHNCPLYCPVPQQLLRQTCCFAPE